MSAQLRLGCWVDIGATDPNSFWETQGEEPGHWGKRMTWIVVTESEVPKGHPRRHSKPFTYTNWCTNARGLSFFYLSVQHTLAKYQLLPESDLPSWNVQSSGSKTLEWRIWHAVKCSNKDISRRQRSTDKHNSLKPDSLDFQCECACIHTCVNLCLWVDFMALLKIQQKELHVTVGNHGNKPKTCLD